MIQTSELISKSKILIVNDDSAELASLISGLESEGFHVSGTTDALTALDTLSHADFDVVLIDLMIPNMSGLKLARKIRTKFPKLITMLMSDYLLSPSQLAKADTGAIGFVPKPYQFEEIAGFIREKLESRFSKGEAITYSSTKSESSTTFDILSVKYTC